MDKKSDIQVSREDFVRYEEVRLSGATNMFDVSAVEFLSGLSKEKIRAIIRDYSRLKDVHLPRTRTPRISDDQRTA